VARFSADFEWSLALDKHAEQVANIGIVVANQDAGH